MAEIFIRYVQEDGDVAREIADGLEEAGYSVWYYERDSLPGHSYLEQILEVLDQAKAIVVILSPATLGSPQVNIEISEAHTAGKRFVPLLRDLNFSTLSSRQRPWTMMFGTAVAAPIPREGVTALLPRLVCGLRAIGVEPTQGAAEEPQAPSPPTPSAKMSPRATTPDGEAAPAAMRGAPLGRGDPAVQPEAFARRPGQIGELIPHARLAPAAVSDESKATSQLAALSQLWGAFAGRGLAAIILALFILAETLSRFGPAAVVPFVLGVYIIIDAVFSMITGAKGGRDVRRPYLLRGVLGMGAGLFILVLAVQGRPSLLWRTGFGNWGVFWWTVFGGWAIIAGVLEVVAAMRFRRARDFAWLPITAGTVSAILGVPFFVPGSTPLLSMFGTVTMSGVYGVVVGVPLLVFGLRLRALGEPGSAERPPASSFPSG